HLCDLLRAPASAPRSAGRRADRLELAVTDLAEQLDEQLLLGAEVPVEGAGSARSITAIASTPAGRVPYARPAPPPIREAQNASATALGACRTSSAPWRASASSSTRRRASNSATPGARLPSRIDRARVATASRWRSSRRSP